MHRLIVVVMAVTLLPITALADPDSNVKSRIAELEQQVAELQAFVLALKPYLRVEEGEINQLAGPHVIFEGANVHVRSGAGATAEGCDLAELPCPMLTGSGNLVVGYNEDGPESPLDRSGSHNLVVGGQHTYSSWGGFVAGFSNDISGPRAAVSGGLSNAASGIGSSVSGGIRGFARGHHSSVSGGFNNFATGNLSSISGGSDNSASSNGSSVSGGTFNKASGVLSSVSGGSFNDAVGNTSSISGGRFNDALDFYSSISGGEGLILDVFGGWCAGNQADDCP